MGVIPGSDLLKAGKIAQAADNIHDANRVINAADSLNDSRKVGKAIDAINRTANYKKIVKDGVEGAGKTTGTVWDKIDITQDFYEGTKIPKSFNITSGNQKIWVHPNGTKHMHEYISRTSHYQGNPLTPVNSQQMLNSFSVSLDEAIQVNGLVTDQIIRSGNWEFILSAPRHLGQNYVVKHALYIP